MPIIIWDDHFNTIVKEDKKQHLYIDPQIPDTLKEEFQKIMAEYRLYVEPRIRPKQECYNDLEKYLYMDMLRNLLIRLDIRLWSHLVKGNNLISFSFEKNISSKNFITLDNKELRENITNLLTPFMMFIATAQLNHKVAIESIMSLVNENKELKKMMEKLDVDKDKVPSEKEIMAKKLKNCLYTSTKRTADEIYLLYDPSTKRSTTQSRINKYFKWIPREKIFIDRETGKPI